MKYLQLDFNEMHSQFIKIRLAKVSHVTQNSFEKQRLYSPKVLVLQTGSCAKRLVLNEIALHFVVPMLIQNTAGFVT